MELSTNMIPNIEYPTGPRKVPLLALADFQHGNSQQRQLFIEQLYSGIIDYGFINLSHHGIEQELITKAYTIVQRLFALPEELKKHYISPLGGGQRGYTAFGTEHAKDSLYPDLKEFWHVGREVPFHHRYFSYYPANLWPAELPQFCAVMSELYRRLDEVANTLLQALTYPLQVEEDYFRQMTEEGNSILRLIHYPPLGPHAPAKSVRAAPHGDINLITLLVGATSSGLELLDRNGLWLAVETVPEHIVVDAGDMLSRLTNEVIPATVHRVVNPAGEGAKTSRYSMPFFVHPHPEAMLSCLPSCQGRGRKYADISAHDFLLQRLRDIGLKT